MTSQKSSTKTALFDLKYSFKNSFAIPALLFAWLVFTAASSSFSELYHNSINVKMQGADITEYIYNFFYNEFSYSNIIMFSIYIASAVSAVLAFWFINSKKQTNVYLSLNIKRTTLMKNRFIACISMLFASILLYMLMLLAVNMFFLEFSKEMIVAWLYLTAGQLISALAVFSITAFAMVCAGGIVEGILYTLVFNLMPTIIFMSTNYILEGLLIGFPRTSSYYSPTAFSTGGSLLQRMNTLNPLLFFNKAWNAQAGTSGITQFGRLSAEDKFSFGFEYVYPILLWIAFSSLIIFAAVKVFNLRKAENAGSFGKNAKAKAVTLTAVCSIVTSFCIGRLEGNIILAIGLGFVAAFIVYLVLEFAILRSFRDVRAGFKKFPIIIGIISLLIIISMTGGFGYSSRIPDASEVSKAYIAVPLYGNFTLGYDYYDTSKCFGPFEAESDIEALLNIHKTAKEESSYKSLESPNPQMYSSDNAISVRYDLKNGGSIIRKYFIPLEKYEELCVTLNKTALITDYVTTLLTIDDEEAFSQFDKNANVYWGYNLTAEQFAEIAKWRNITTKMRTGSLSGAYIAPPDLLSSNPEPLSQHLSESDYVLLKQYMLEDYLASSPENRVNSKEKVLGSLIFDSYATMNPSNLTADDPEMFTMGVCSAIINVTKSMTKTLTFLESRELTKYFESTKTISSAAILTEEDFMDNVQTWNYWFYGTVTTYRAFTANLTNKTYIYDGNGSHEISINWIENYKNAGITYYTDEKTINELRERASLYSLTNEKNEFVNLVFSDGSFIILPID